MRKIHLKGIVTQLSIDRFFFFKESPQPTDIIKQFAIPHIKASITMQYSCSCFPNGI